MSECNQVRVSPAVNRKGAVMTSSRKAALIAGLCYLTTLVASIVAVALIAPVLNNHDYLTGAGSDTRVTAGCLLGLVDAFACVGTAVTLFPVTRRQNEGLAIGFVASRSFEAAVIVIGVVSLLAVVTLRRDLAGVPGPDQAALVAAGRSLVAVRNWTFLLGPGPMPVFNGLLGDRDPADLRLGAVGRALPGGQGVPPVAADRLAPVSLDKWSSDGGVTLSKRGGTAGQYRAERELVAITGGITAELLRDSHLMRPADVAGALARAARPLGVSGAQIYLADLQQRQLKALTASEGQHPEALAIDSTLAGQAFQRITIESVPLAAHAHQVWIPLVDGTERLGVLSLTVTDSSETMLDQYRTLASLAGVMVMAKASYSDTYAQAQRVREMALQAELVWAFLAPRTFATDQVLISASLEPAYEAGGDAFDYSLLDDHLHVSIFDALGHDLSAGLLASVGIAACRRTRRSGGSLEAIAAQADDAIAGYFGDDRFVTALLCDLDLASGLFTWIPCGHPPPLLIRGNRTVRELARTAQPPLGLAGVFARRGGAEAGDAASAVVCAEKLEPGDRLLLYTDGVTEGRSADGTQFGVERLADFIIRHSGSQLPAPETMRRLNHAILDYQDGRPRDDATAIMVEWRPRQPGPSLTP